MIAPDVVQQLEAARVGLLADLAKLDDAIAALTDGTRPTPDARPAHIPRGRPVKKAPPARGTQSTKHLDGKRTGRAPTWDIVMGEQYWKTKPDMTTTEIADRLGTTPKLLRQHAARHDWGLRAEKAAGTSRRKCRACGSTVTSGQACPACGIPA